MKLMQAVMMFALVGSSSCFSPVDVPLGTLDAGASGGGATGGNTGGGGGMTGGGGAPGGGAATGGGGGAVTGGGGGTQQISDAGLVAPLARLPETRCGLVAGLLSECPADAGSCIALLKNGQAPVNVAAGSDVAPSGASLRAVAPAAGGFLFSVTQPGGMNTALWYAREGQAPRVIQSAPQLNVLGVADSPGYGVWYIAEPNSLNGVLSRNLMLLTGASTGGAPTVASPTLQTPPTSNAVAVGTDYFIAFADGLHWFYPAGGSLLSPLTSLSGEHETIISVAADDTDVVFLQCTDFPARCGLLRYDRSNGQTTVLVRGLEGLVGGVSTGASVALAGGHAYVLGVLHLLRVPRAGGAIELVYAGEEFPQYTGTLRGGSLEALSGKLYFGSVCHFDADLPGYGAVELDPATLTARWLELDPNYPFVPHLEPSRSWPDLAWPTPAGVFVAR